MLRRTEGREAWHRLLEWDRGQAASERLAAILVMHRGYTGIDPSHPLGGPDGGKDAVCYKGDDKHVVACYFPRGQQDFKTIAGKFGDDYEGVGRNDAAGLVFVTNQELRIGERESPQSSVDADVDLLHLETISAMLNAPAGYGIRLEFLGIAMNEEEQLAFVSAHDTVVANLVEAVRGLERRLAGGQDEEPQCVSPRTIRDFTFASIFSDRYHRCTKCGFGFIVTGGAYTFTYASILSASATQVVTCPKCGNSDPWSGSPW